MRLGQFPLGPVLAPPTPNPLVSRRHLGRSILSAVDRAVHESLLVRDVFSSKVDRAVILAEYFTNRKPLSGTIESVGPLRVFVLLPSVFIYGYGGSILSWEKLGQVGGDERS